MAKKPKTPPLAARLQQAFALHQQGLLDPAWSAYEEILRANPTLPDAWHLSGCIALDRGDPGEALRRFDRALEQAVGNASFLVSRGNALAALGRSGEAENAYRLAINANPRFGAAYNNLGNLLLGLGRPDEAIGAFDLAIVNEPRHVNALLALGRLLAERDAIPQALALLGRAHEAAPGNTRVLLELARVHFAARHYAAAMQALEQVRSLDPGSTEAYSGIGEILRTTARFSEAEVAYRRALELSPGDIDASNGLTLVLNRLGRIDEAVSLARTQTRHSRTNPAGHSNLLFIMNNLPNVSAAELYREHRAWNDIHARPLAPIRAASAEVLDPDKRLRIGYVSADFCGHSVAFFIEPILAGHDRSQFEIFAYYNSKRVDPVTLRLKALDIAWRDVAALSDDALAALIRQDAIDILVDLNGHTGMNRLLTFARQPAPLQMTYLGYPNSTGLDAIQYRISDAVADPPGSEVFSSETLLRLPDCFHCYRPAHGGDPDVVPPSQASGQVTFASFNVLSKINPQVIAAWSGILAAVPESRLLLKTSGLGDGGAHAALIASFAVHGIDATRLVLAGHQDSHAEHMARYREVDIALDPFPYCGTTTTCDALWMGVPVVTLYGERHAGRVGASLLHAVGLDDLITKNLDEYIAQAVSLATDRHRLERLHRELRARVRNSPLTDEARFVRNIEALYRAAWCQFCRPPAAAPQPSGASGPHEPSRRLLIGGREPCAGWELMNIVAGPGVDHEGNANDLSRFADDSFDTIYASHVLEHLDYKDELQRTLREWVRVLKPGGELLISVPDLEVLAAIILDPKLSPADRFWAMGMIFGGHRDEHDYHQVGLTEEFIRQYLRNAGAVEVARVDSFSLFADASEISHAGRRISLNVRARKPERPVADDQRDPSTSS